MVAEVCVQKGKTQTGEMVLELTSRRRSTLGEIHKTKRTGHSWWVGRMIDYSTKPMADMGGDDD